MFVTCIQYHFWEVSVALLNLSRKCVVRIWRSSRTVVTRGRPLLGRSFTVPVVWNLVLSFQIQILGILKWLATCKTVTLALSMPMASERCLLVNLGMVYTHFLSSFCECYVAFWLQRVRKRHLHAQIGLKWSSYGNTRAARANRLLGQTGAARAGSPKKMLRLDSWAHEQCMLKKSSRYN